MNLLITGIHGFVGTNLVETLKENHIIYGIDIIKPSKVGVLRTFSWDELDEIPTIDVVIHLAGKAHDTKNQTNARSYFDINTGLTQKIYDWYLESPSATKFIFFSSVKAAAEKVEGEFLTEDVVPTPKGPYGESKIAAENYLLSKQSVVNSQMKKTYILRPCMIHGPGNKGNLNLLFNVVKRGIPYPLGSFQNKRSFTSIDNLNFIVGKLIENDVPTGIYNVADDGVLSTNEIISLISKVLEKKEKICYWDPRLIRFGALIGTLFRLPLNKERLQKLTENYVVSNQKLKKALSIDYMPLSAKDGFYKTIKSFTKV